MRNLTANEDVEGDQRRAEIFDALSHPTRIMILKALGEGTLGFADLKKKTGIDSSGHLQHHLSKLGPLVKTDDYGKYRLSDQGKDALLTVQTVENAAVSGGEKGRKWPHAKSLRNKNILKTVAVGFAVLLLASIALNIYESSQTALLQNQVSQRDLAISQLQDISQIQIVKSTPDIGMSFVFRTILVGNDTTNLKPYTLSVSIAVQIRNPTPYNVTLQLQGELNITLSGQESGNRVWNETRYFSVTMHSDNSYDFSLYRGGNYADQNAISATVNSCEVYVVSCHILSES
jgi:DNA-binding HxlR family transcriptional regulator